MFTTEELLAAQAIIDENISEEPVEGGTAIIVQDEGVLLTDGVTKFNFAGTGVTVTEPAPDELLVTISGGSQVGIASILPSADVYPLFEAHGNVSATALNSTTRLQIMVAEIDAAITFTDIVLGIVAASAGNTIDVGIYQFLGCGKPGICLAKAQLSTTATGKILGTVGTPVTLQPGLYFVAIHGTSITPTLASNASGTQNMRNVPLLVSNGFEYLATGGNHYECALLNDSTLPGGAYTYGMNLTGLNMTSTGITGYNSIYPLVGLKKQ